METKDPKQIWLIDQWDGTENSHIGPYTLSHLIFEKGQQHTLENKHYLQQVMLVKQGNYMQEKETSSLSPTLYETQH